MHPLIEKRACDVISALSCVPRAELLQELQSVFWCKCVNKGAKRKVVRSEVRVLSKNSWKINKGNNQWFI